MWSGVPACAWHYRIALQSCGVRQNSRLCFLSLSTKMGISKKGLIGSQLVSGMVGSRRSDDAISA